MTRQEAVFSLIKYERERQDKRWSEFDERNTLNDWVTYLTKYLGKVAASAGTFEGQLNVHELQESLVKLAALCVAILERDSFAPRHYETGVPTIEFRST